MVLHRLFAVFAVVIGYCVGVLLQPVSSIFAYTPVFPSTNWVSKTPEELGVDGTYLDTFATNLGTGHGFIVKDGYVIKQWGTVSQKADYASAAKPVTSTLLLFALQEGKISSVDDPVKNYTNWAFTAEDEAITFRHLFNNVSGYARGEAPGAAFAYNDTAIQLYNKSLFDQIFNEGSPNAAATNVNRLGALGLQDGTLYSSRNGYGVSSSVRDMARIGWFWLNEGNWNGTQLLPSSYFDTYFVPQVSSSVPISSTSDTDYLAVGSVGGGTSQTTYGPGIYGFNLWHNPNQSTWPAGPADMYEANGSWGSQVVAVFPSYRMVVSARGTWGTFDPGNANATDNQNIALLVNAVKLPRLSLTALAQTYQTTNAVTLSGSVIDPVSTIDVVSYKIDEGSWTSCSATDGTFDEEVEDYSCSITGIADGDHTLSVRATGEDGDHSATSTQSVVVDTLPPALSVTPVAPDPTTQTTPTIVGNAVDADSIVTSVELRIDETGSWHVCVPDDGAFDEATEYFSCTTPSTLSTGLHTYQLRATDQNGHTTSAASYATDTFTIATGTTWTQTDWSGGSGQTSWSTSTRYASGTDIGIPFVGRVRLERAYPSTWYNQAWFYRQPLTIQAAQVESGGDLTSFPVLLTSSDATLVAQAQSDGDDIVFTSSDGTTQLDYELERYSSGSLVAWVRIPTLSASTNTPLYMYFGNGSTASVASPSAVWDSNYQAVWHLDEATDATQLDSTTKANNMSPTSSPARAEGKFGYGLDFERSDPDYLSRTDGNLSAQFPAKNGTTTSAYTSSAWVKFESLDSSRTPNMIVKGNNYFMYSDNPGLAFYTNFNGSGLAQGTSTVTTNTWYSVSTVWNGSTVQVYYNGTAEGSGAALASMPTNTSDFLLGTRNDKSTLRSLDGIMDEVRVSNAVRSAQWIKTEYTNQSNPATFTTASTVETNTFDTTGSLTSSIYDTGEASAFGVLSIVANVPTGAGVSLKVRSGNQSDLSDAAAFSACSTVASGTDLSSTSCVTDGDRYIQYQATLSTGSSSESPSLHEVSLAYSTYVAPTPTPTASPSSSSSSGASQSVGTTGSDPSSCGVAVPGNPAPVLMAATATSATSVQLMTTSITGPRNQIVIAYGTTPAASQYGTTVATTTATSVAIYSLEPGTTYYFRLRAGNDCGVGPWSNTISVTTPSITPLTYLAVAQLQTTQRLQASTPVASPRPTTEDNNQTPIPSVPPGLAAPEQPRSTITIHLKDSQGRPLNAVTVILHSTPREGVTDENGVVSFTDVEYGQHKLIVQHKDYAGEQSLHVDETTDVVQLTVAVTPTRASTESILLFIGSAILFLASIGVAVMTQKRGK